MKIRFNKTSNLTAILPAVLCGAPPEVENASKYGDKKEYYPVKSIIRYQCNAGFRQRHTPVVHCKADGQWEKPQVQCTAGESIHTHIQPQGELQYWCAQCG